jgi:hypothetical protein
MGSDVKDFLDPTSSSLNRIGSNVSTSDPQTDEEKAQLFIDPGGHFSKEDIMSFFDPLDLLGQQEEAGIEEAGGAARARIAAMMQAANAMRHHVLAQIQQRDLAASRTTAAMRREQARRTGRSSTVFNL